MNKNGSFSKKQIYKDCLKLSLLYECGIGLRNKNKSQYWSPRNSFKIFFILPPKTQTYTEGRHIFTKKNGQIWGASLAPPVEHVTLDLKVVSSRPILGVETKKNCFLRSLKYRKGGSKLLYTHVKKLYVSAIVSTNEIVLDHWGKWDRVRRSC